MYRFLLRPSWVLLHLVIAALVVGMVNLSLWQIRRLEEKQARNALIEANTRRQPMGLAEAGADVAARSAEQVRFTRVRVTGRYDLAGEVAVRNRSDDGAPGRWVVTPLVPSGGGAAVLVLRGFMPLRVSDPRPPYEEVSPPAGDVTVVGYLQPSERKTGFFGATDRPTGRLPDVARMEVPRIDRQYAGELVPFWLQLAEQDPPTTSAALSPVPLPALDDGPHFSYAVQWAIFVVVVVVGYPLALRKVARDRGRHGGKVVASAR